MATCSGPSGRGKISDLEGNVIDTPHSRRMVTMADYEYADLIDDQDKIRLLVDPTSTYARAAASAMGRAIDDVIIAAAIGTVSRQERTVPHLLYHAKQPKSWSWLGKSDDCKAAFSKANHG